jgi:hypothetical protein
VAGYDLIAAYLSELRVSLGSFAATDTVLEEAEDHLLEAVEHLEVAGLSCRDAQVQALARFGSAPLVSKVCVVESRKGAAVSTTFTRRAGLISTTTPLLVVLGALGNEVFYQDKEGLRGTLHGMSSGVLFPLGLCAFLIGLLGLRARHRGLGRLGTAAFVTVLAAPFIAVPFGWGAGLAAVLVLDVAVILLGIGMLRAGVLPVAPLVLFVAGPVLMFLITFVLLPTVSYADLVLYAPLLLTLLAMSWLGWYQWNEPALDGPRGSRPLATA